MKSRPPSWDDLRFLLAVHREKSFFAAGKSLGVAASTVARRVEAIERSLGRVLVHRCSDGTQLDSDALRLVALAEELELGLGSLIRDGREAEVSGTVRVSLSEGFVRPLVPLLARLQAKHPALRVEVISESRIADLARGEADIGIRIVPSVVQATSLSGLVQLDIESVPPPVEVFLALRRDARKTSRVRVVAREIEADARRRLR
jgi:DNA-binding transcriptional LysR family regulator